MAAAAKLYPKTATGVVVAATIGNMVCLTACVSSAFGVFLVPISEDFGWPRSQVTTVLGIIALVSVIAYPIVGRLIDRFGARRVILTGNVLLALSVAAVSQANGSVLQFYLLFVIIGIAGSIPTAAMFSKVVGEWFDENRGLMLGVSAGLGNGIGATIMPVIAAIFLQEVGWKMSYALIGAIVFAVGFPTMYFLLREAPKTPGPAITGGTTPAPEIGLTFNEAVRTPVFWLILLSFGLGAGSLTAVFSHVIPVLTDRGFDLAHATGVMSTFALVTAGWQIVTGAILDRVARPQAVAPWFVLACAGLWLLQYGHSNLELFGGATLLGIGLGAAYGALNYFISRYFGFKAFGAITGVTYSVVMLAQGVTPFLMDVWFDHEGSYTGSLWIIGGSLVASAALILFFPPYRVHSSAADLAKVATHAL